MQVWILDVTCGWSSNLDTKHQKSLNSIFSSSNKNNSPFLLPRTFTDLSLINGSLHKKNLQNNTRMKKKNCNIFPYLKLEFTFPRYHRHRIVSIIIYIDNGGKKSAAQIIAERSEEAGKNVWSCLFAFMLYLSSIFIKTFLHLSSINVMLNIVNAHHGF